MKLDTFVQLVKDLRQGQITDDTDPNNVLLQQYSSPTDAVSNSESIQTFTSSGTHVWSDGTTYTAYDSNGNPWQAPSCGWLWSAGGRWN